MLIGLVIVVIVVTLWHASMVHSYLNKIERHLDKINTNLMGMK